MRMHKAATLWIVLLLGNTVHTRRTSERLRSRSGRRTQISAHPWAPVRDTNHQAEAQWTHDPWMPQQAIHHRDGGDAQLWTPQVVQQTQSQIPDDSWLPEDVQQQQSQLELTWPDQRPQQAAGVCSFDYDNVPEDHVHPFLVRDDNQGILYPDWVGLVRVMEMPRDTTVIASCPGRGNTLLAFEQPYIYITCSRRGDLLHGKKIVTWAELGCLKKTKPTLKRRGACGEGGSTRVIGWNIGRGIYIPQVTLCFDESQEIALFASHTIHGRYIDAKFKDTSRPGFKSSRMFTVSMGKSYRVATQKSLLQGLLNTTSHLTGTGQHYLAKGHLAPDADFVLEAEQDATYYYANAAPQWQAVNNGNWKRLEGQVRELAERRTWPLEVWTGTHGTLQLPDFHNKPVKLYLGLTFRREVVPVPALFWKVIHDPVTHTAVAIIMVNDVRGRGTSDSWRLTNSPCPDLCSRLSWINWRTSDVSRGMTFCCSVDALRSTIPDLPVLGHVGLLRY